MVGALTEGRVFVDLSYWRKVAVTGGDAVEWLNDLVSADVADLLPGRARRSLLLSPTGQVRAEFDAEVFVSKGFPCRRVDQATHRLLDYSALADSL